MEAIKLANRKTVLTKWYSSQSLVCQFHGCHLSILITSIENEQLRKVVK